MFVVVLQNAQNLVEPCAGNKDHALPIVNHPSGNLAAPSASSLPTRFIITPPCFNFSQARVLSASGSSSIYRNAPLLVIACRLVEILV
jgi:hypothetical protein